MVDAGFIFNKAAMLRKTRGEKTFITTKLKSSHQAWSNGQFKVSYSQTTGVKERK
jgi:hypothetical protein